MPTGARGYSDAPRITVNELLKDPLVIPALILDITQNEFIMDSVLRIGGAAAGSPWCLQRTSLAHAGGRAGPALSCGSVRVQSGSPPRLSRYGARRPGRDPAVHGPRGPYRSIGACQSHGGQSGWPRFVRDSLQWSEIGRASCRERV